MFTQIHRFFVLSSCLCFSLVSANQELDRLAESIYKHSKAYEIAEASIDLTFKKEFVDIILSEEEKEQYKRSILSDRVLKTPYASMLKEHFTKEELVALDRFWKSRIGQSISEKNIVVEPELANQLTHSGQKIMQGIVTKRLLMGIHEQRLENTKKKLREMGKKRNLHQEGV